MAQIKFDGARWSFEDGQFWLCLRVPMDGRAAARHFVQTVRDVLYCAEIKEYRPRRSRDANAYFWELCGRLAEKIQIPKTEIYRQYVRDIGGNSEILPIRRDAVEKFVSAWEKNGLGWVCDRTGSSKLPGYENIIVYFGSSTYDTRQMSRLIGLAVQDCEAQGIETLPPQKLSALMEDWKCAKEQKDCGSRPR